MQFDSFIFICAFMPLMVMLYFAGMKIHSLAGKILLIVGSVLFYAYSGWSTLIVMGISLVINFGFAIYIERFGKRRKLYLAIPAVINVVLLLYFKYVNIVIGNCNLCFGTEFALKEFVIPIGISVFTFQQIAYVIAVYKGEIEKVKVVDYLAYILYFPKILMGPLMDPVDFINQVNDEKCKTIDWDNIACGLKIFCFGLFKKALLADTFANAVSWGYTNMGTATSADWLLIMLFYTFEIYFVFSGYSDMAVGSSLMLNIVLPINFDSPYKAVSIRDFWKRWNISLTQFFTKYVFIPLGGSKKGMIRTCINFMIVFLISGIWYGAGWTFILWGVLIGALSLFGVVFNRILSLFGVVFNRALSSLRAVLNRTQGLLGGAPGRILSFLDRMTAQIHKKPIGSLRRMTSGDKKSFKYFRWALAFAVTNVLWLLFRSDSVGQWGKILATIGRFADMNVSNDLMNIFSVPETLFLNHVIPVIGSLSGMIRGFWMLVFVFSSAIICFIPVNNYKKLRENSIVTMLLAAAGFVWGIISLSSESVFVYFGF